MTYSYFDKNPRDRENRLILLYGSIHGMHISGAELRALTHRQRITLLRRICIKPVSGSTNRSNKWYHCSHIPSKSVVIKGI